MKEITKEIKHIYNEEFLRLNAVYPITRPKLKVRHYLSGTAGSYYTNTNRIAINSNSKHVRQTIIHELCHHIMNVHFNPEKKRLRHNKQFWLLCYEFGLTEKDYGYGLTNSMRKAKEEFYSSNREKVCFL